MDWDLLLRLLTGRPTQQQQQGPSNGASSISPNASPPQYLPDGQFVNLTRSPTLRVPTPVPGPGMGREAAAQFAPAAEDWQRALASLRGQAGDRTRYAETVAQQHPAFHGGAPVHPTTPAPQLSVIQQIIAAAQRDRQAGGEIPGAVIHDRQQVSAPAPAPQAPPQVFAPPRQVISLPPPLSPPAAEGPPPPFPFTQPGQSAAAPAPTVPQQIVPNWPVTPPEPPPPFPFQSRGSAVTPRTSVNAAPAPAPAPRPTPTSAPGPMTLEPQRSASTDWRNRQVPGPTLPDAPVPTPPSGTGGPPFPVFREPTTQIAAPTPAPAPQQFPSAAPISADIIGLPSNFQFGPASPPAAPAQRSGQKPPPAPAGVPVQQPQPAAAMGTELPDHIKEQLLEEAARITLARRNKAPAPVHGPV